MRGISNKLYATGVLLVIIGGAGISDATSDIGFWIYAILFGLGFGFCLAGYTR